MSRLGQRLTPRHPFTEEEEATAKRLSIETAASLPQAYDIVERCRGVGITAAEVMKRSDERNLNPIDAFRQLFDLEEAAGKILHTPLTPEERAQAAAGPPQPPPPAAPPPQPGDTLHLREPRNKAERRLQKEIEAAVGARNVIIGQLARVNRRVAKAEKALREADMIVRTSNEGPTKPGEGS